MVGAGPIFFNGLCLLLILLPQLRKLVGCPRSIVLGFCLRVYKRFKFSLEHLTDQLSFAFTMRLSLNVGFVAISSVTRHYLFIFNCCNIIMGWVLMLAKDS